MELKRAESASAINESTQTSLLMDNSQAALQHYIAAGTSDNTRKAYRSAIRQFEKWGGRLPTDSSVLVRYLIERAGQLNPRTLELHITAISQWHHLQLIPDPSRTPLVRKTIDGIRRTHGKPKIKAKALRLEHLVTMLSTLQALPDSNKKARDRALLLVGFFGAFRRSELVAITVEDLSWEPEGVLISLPKSKTDQELDGLNCALPYGNEPICPVKALKNWLGWAGISQGPVFKPVNRWDQIQD